MRSPADAIGGAWNIQSGRKVYPMNFGTSDVDGIMQSIHENGYRVVPRGQTWLAGFWEGALVGVMIGWVIAMVSIAALMK